MELSNKTEAPKENFQIDPGMQCDLPARAPEKAHNEAWQGENVPTSEMETESRPGVLRAEGYESNCRVTVRTQLTHGMPPVMWSREIDSVEKMLPDGDYMLSVGDGTSKVRLSRGIWLVIGY